MYDEIKRKAEEFSKEFDGRIYYEEWFNDKKQRMLKVVLTFKMTSDLPTQ